MSQSCHSADAKVLIRFWSLNHYRPETVLWPVSPWAKVVFALEGVLRVESARRVHLIPPNRALFVPAGEAHPTRTLSKAQVRTIYFAPELGVECEQHVLEVRPLFRELMAEACRIGPLRADREAERALATLLTQEVHAAPRVATSIPMPSSNWAREWAVAFLDDPIQCDLTGFSARTLERRMLAETGFTLGRWRQQARALVGLRELSLGASVLQAADSAGFETSSGFIQSFKKQFGTTPARLARGLPSHDEVP